MFTRKVKAPEINEQDALKKLLSNPGLEAVSGIREFKISAEDYLSHVKTLSAGLQVTPLPSGGTRGLNALIRMKEIAQENSVPDAVIKGFIKEVEQLGNTVGKELKSTIDR